MNNKTKPSELFEKLSADDVLDILTFVEKFHHYVSQDRKLLPDVKRDWLKKSFLLKYKIEAFADDMEV